MRPLMKKKYGQDFKLEAINLVVNDNRLVAAVANELGIHLDRHTLLVNQVSEYEGNAFPGSGNLRPEDEELRKLRRKKVDLEEENAILKRATAIFAKHQK